MRRFLALVVLVAAACLPSGFPYRGPWTGHGSDGGRPASDVADAGVRLAEAPPSRPPLPLALPYAERLSLGGALDEVEVATFSVRLAPPEVLHLASVAGEGARGGLSVDILQSRGTLGVVQVATYGGPGGGAAGHPSADAATARAATPIDARWAPPVADDFVVRVRASPGSVGAFGLALARRPPLDFPVATEAKDAVRSVFGDARDGGAREHHGIDIFAPRGTPVLAAADGFVARVGTSARGGLHVWQRAVDEEGGRIGSLYYAHLDTVAVLAGTRVARGEVLGTVGNTGNARTTPPHLHFGLYRRPRGPTDPLPLVGRARAAPVAVAPGHALAPWLAVASPALNLRAGPGTEHEILGRLVGGSLVRVLGLGDEWVRVRAHAAPLDAAGGGAASSDVASGGAALEGFVARALLETPRPAPFSLAGETPLLAAPEPGAPRIALVAAGTTVSASGAFGPHRLVELEGGARGWVTEAPAGAAAEGPEEGRESGPDALSDG